MRSIQEILRKINSFLTEKVSIISLISLSLFSLVVAGTMLFAYIDTKDDFHHFVYTENNSLEGNVSFQDSSTNFVGSKSGATYYYSWCKAVSRIKPQNRVYFVSEEVAQASDRTLSKTCTK